MSKCDLCGTETKDPKVELPGITFNFLEGKPMVCERCVARTNGIEASWLPEIEEKLKEPEI